VSELAREPVLEAAEQVGEPVGVVGPVGALVLG